MTRAVTKHTITGSFSGEVELEYDAQTGLLVYMGLGASLDEERHRKFLAVLPHHVSGLKAIHKPPHSIVTTISKEITFNDFWNAYGYKEDKEVAIRRWKALTTKDRIAAYNYIDVYEDILRKKQREKLLPSTYLNKKRWNDGK